MRIGQVSLAAIGSNPPSRNAIPAVWQGLPRSCKPGCARCGTSASCRRSTARAGLDLGQILGLGALQQRLGCACDRLQELAHRHATVRAFPEFSAVGDRTQDKHRTVVDNVSLRTPELLAAVGDLGAESGRKVGQRKPSKPLRGRCDSLGVETDVQYPTDVSLLRDAVRCLARETGRPGVRGWRQQRHLTHAVQKRLHQVRSTRRAQQHPARGEAYTACCRALIEWAEDTLAALRGRTALASAGRSSACAPPAPPDQPALGSPRMASRRQTARRSCPRPQDLPADCSLGLCPQPAGPRRNHSQKPGLLRRFPPETGAGGH